MKLRYIDAIRGMAILGVFIVHVAANPQLPSLAQQVIAIGAKGVQLFFLASAFTLFLSSGKKLVQERYPIANFFTRRFFRIAPLYYLAIIYFYFQFTYAGDQITPGLVVANVFFIHGVRPDWINSLVPGGWSITVEMMFYLIVPFLASIITTLNRAIIFLAITLFCRMIFVVVMKWYVIPENTELNHDFLYYCLPNQLPIFALGICAYHFVMNQYSFHSTKWFSWLILVIATAVNLPIRELIPYHYFISIGFVLLFIILSKKSYRLFVNPFTIYLGKISFSLYLVHFAFNFWITRWMDHYAVADKIGFIPAYVLHFVVIFILSVAVSTLLYHTVEVKMQKLGSRIVKRREGSLISKTATANG